MRHLWIGITLLLATVATAQDDAFDVEDLISRWVAMWNSYDLDQVEELFLNTDQVTYFSSEKQGLVRGIDAVREHHRGFGFVPGGHEPERELWVEGVEADVFGSSAVVTAIWYFGARAEKGEAQRGPMTFVYVMHDGEFRLVHLHFANYEAE